MLIRPGASPAQTKDRWANSQRKLLKAALRREGTLIERNRPIYIFRACQVSFNAFVTVSSVLFDPWGTFPA